MIAVATIVAFHIGLANGGAALGSTMAFSTLCLSRLFHGFNCKADRPVLFPRTFWNNSFLLGAFVIGAVLLGLTETILLSMLGSGYSTIATFAIMLVFLLVRPQGIAGSNIQEKA